MSANQKKMSQKEMIRYIVDDEFDIQHSDQMVQAKIDFEEALYEDCRLKLNYHNAKIPSLMNIMKKHSLHYDEIKDKVYKNKHSYIQSYFGK